MPSCLKSEFLDSLHSSRPSSHVPCIHCSPMAQTFTSLPLPPSRMESLAALGLPPPTASLLHPRTCIFSLLRKGSLTCEHTNEGGEGGFWLRRPDLEILSPVYQGKKGLDKNGCRVMTFLSSNIPQLLGKTLVGRFNGKYLGEKALTSWLQNHWKPLIGYVPKIHILSRSWISFSFLSDDDCEEIHRQSWSWGPSGLSLKPWTVDFDPLKESMVVMKVWEIFPDCLWPSGPGKR
jgi:hypothetical protein